MGIRKQYKELNLSSKMFFIKYSFYKLFDALKYIVFNEYK